MATPDITTGLQLQYLCNDAVDGVMTDAGPNSLDLTVTMDGLFPTRGVIAGKNSRLFSRAHTTSTSSVPSNFGKRQITTAQLQAIFGANNGNNGEHTVAFWTRRTPTQAGEGTGLEDFLLIGGDGNAADPNADQSTAVLIRQGRSVASNQRFAWFVGRVSGGSLLSSTFSPALQPGSTLDNTWTHLAFVCRADVAGTSCFVDFYVNGVLTETSASTLCSTAMAGTYPASTGVILVSSGTKNRDGTSNTIGQVGGGMADIRAYSRALTATDIRALYDGLAFVDPTSIAQAVSIGAPRVAIASAFVGGPATAPATAAKKTSTAPVPAANSKSTYTVG